MHTCSGGVAVLEGRCCALWVLMQEDRGRRGCALQQQRLFSLSSSATYACLPAYL
jgi:hypothetical protein